MREYNPLSLRFIKDLQKVTVDNLNSISFSISSLISQILSNIKEINIIKKDVSFVKNFFQLELYYIYQGTGTGAPLDNNFKIDSTSFSPSVAFNISKKSLNNIESNMLSFNINNVVLYQSSSIYKHFVLSSINDNGTYYQIKTSTVSSVGALVVGSLLKITFYSR